MTRQSTEDIEGIENTLHDTLMIDTPHFTFVQTHRIHSTKSEF